MAEDKLQAYFKKFITNQCANSSDSEFDIVDISQFSTLDKYSCESLKPIKKNKSEKNDIFQKIDKTINLNNKKSSEKSNDSKYDFIYSGMFDDSDETNKNKVSVKKKINN